MSPRRRRTALGAGAWLLAAALRPCRVLAAVEPPRSAFDVSGMPYAAFDRLPAVPIDVPGGVIRLAFVPDTVIDLPRARVAEWVRRCAGAVANYYGRFPAPDTRLLVSGTATGGRPVRSGTTFAYAGAAIKLTLSEHATLPDLDRDWVLVHEMTHLAFPSVPARHHWIEEGIATYVEPLARAQVGALGLDAVWGDMLTGMPNGLPQVGDQGLDRTPTWGRTYWGGALFALLADVGIRERTANAKGLQHALRAILAHGNMELDSALAPLLRIGDAAVGVPVLSELYESMKEQPHPVDLDALWQRLGVRLRDGGVLFDDSAPLAAVRRALTVTPRG